MPVLRTPSESEQYGEHSLIADRAVRRLRIRVWRGIGMLMYTTSYPLLGLALWTGTQKGAWAAAAALVALGVLASFVGWGLLSAPDRGGDGGSLPHSRTRSPRASTFLALYSRTGAIVIVLGSYTIAARNQGWPLPESFAGWFALVWVPLFVAFVLPVERAPPPRDDDW
jgi:hypothetical protein